MKMLIIALATAPLLTLAAGNMPQKNAPVSKQTVEKAISANKLILVVNRAEADAPLDILENRHTARFLAEHFIIEQQAEHHAQDMYLVYNQQRELVHRVANERYPYELAVKIKRALDPNTQYYTLLARFEQGDRSAALLENLIIGASDAADRENAPRFMRAYLDTQESALTAENLRFLATHTTASSDPGFAIMLDNMAVADDMLGTGKMAEKLSAIIFEEVFVPHLGDKHLDLEDLTAEVKATYQTTDLAQSIDRMPIELLEMREDWEGLKSALPTYLNAHGAQLSQAMRDYYAWLGNEYL